MTDSLWSESTISNKQVGVLILGDCTCIGILGAVFYRGAVERPVKLATGPSASFEINDRECGVYYITFEASSNISFPYKFDRTNQHEY